MRTYIILLLLAASPWLLAQNGPHQGEEIQENHQIGTEHGENWDLPKSIQKFNKKNKVLNRISAGSVLIEGEEQEVGTFYMQPTEVTNLAYREFLKDLKKKGLEDQFGESQHKNGRRGNSKEMNIRNL